LKLYYDEVVSSVAFKFNLRRYTQTCQQLTRKVTLVSLDPDDTSEEQAALIVRRCRLTVSKPVLEALVVSALETTI